MIMLSISKARHVTQLGVSYSFVFFKCLLSCKCTPICQLYNNFGPYKKKIVVARCDQSQNLSKKSIFFANFWDFFRRQFSNLVMIFKNLSKSLPNKKKSPKLEKIKDFLGKSLTLIKSHGHKKLYFFTNPKTCSR